MKINFNCNTPFGTKYKFVSKSELEKEIEKRPDAIEVWYSGAAYDISTGGEAIYTKKIFNCTAYGTIVHNYKEVYLEHANHYSKTARLTDYRQEGDVVNAFLIGGKTKYLSKYFKAALETYQRNKVPTTYFWGQDDGYTNGSGVLYDPKTDVAYISSGEREIKDEKDLKSAYRFIDVADCDEVIIKERKINPESVKNPLN